MSKHIFNNYCDYTIKNGVEAILFINYFKNIFKLYLFIFVVCKYP